MGGGGGVQETAAQKAMAEYASNLMTDYKQRWAPVQQQLTKTVELMGREGSAAREAATGRAAADVETQFGQAGQKLQSGLASSGVGVGSSKGKLAMGGLSLDKAAAKGQNVSIADQAITSAYMQGLSGIAAAGRGQKSLVSTGLQQQAAVSASQAAQDASISLQNRMGNAQLAGQAVGLGFSRAMTPSGDTSTPAGINGGTYLPNSLRGQNNYG